MRADPKAVLCLNVISSQNCIFLHSFSDTQYYLAVTRLTYLIKCYCYSMTPLSVPCKCTLTRSSIVLCYQIGSLHGWEDLVCVHVSWYLSPISILHIDNSIFTTELKRCETSRFWEWIVLPFFFFFFCISTFKAKKMLKCVRQEILIPTVWFSLFYIKK